MTAPAQPVTVSVPADVLAQFDALRQPGQTRSGLIAWLIARYVQEVTP